ncbi:MAG: hypothetical protein AAF333_03180 [Planctomycetota bacterium]
MKYRFMVLVLAGWLGASAVDAEPIVVRDSATFAAEADRAGPGTGLEALTWDAEGFTAQLVETPGRDYDARVTFASPHASGDGGVDTVALRWYRPTAPGHDETDAAASLPGAVLIVHTLHPDLPVATFLARGLRAMGVNAFVIELPGYGSRRATPRRMTGVTTLIRGTQAVTDCRRAYDVIRALSERPGSGFDGQRVAIQGTSLGSFVACSAAAIDGCFDQTFLFLSGGDGMSILQDGQKDAFHVRGALKHYGYEGARLRELMDTIEPMRIAHRLDPAATWMFNARDDLVVPAKNAKLLAQAIELDASHHVWLPGNHYTAFILLPGVLDRMQQEMNARRRSSAAGDAE